MGRALGFLADVLALARLALELRTAWRENARLGAEADPLGAPDVGGSAEARSEDGARGVGPSGPSAGSAAGEERASTDGAVTRG